jgi:alpha/beta superfamily hydrolase
MSRQGERQIIRGPAGALEIAVHRPERNVRGVALVAHPHPQQGGTMDNKVVHTLAKAFFNLGYLVVRFNFRGVGGSIGSYDEGRGETDDAEAALEHARGGLADAPVVLAGFSFGSFVQTRLYERVKDRVPIERMVLVGPAVGRFELAKVPADTLVVHGEEDDVVPLPHVFDWARPLHLPILVFPGCGHFFHGRLVQLQQVIERSWR